MSTNLDRFIEAQAGVYEKALSEIRAGRKTGHWMWYIFPQFRGLGFSETSIYYSIQNLEEARDFLNHPVLGNRLRLITQELILSKEGNANQIFCSPDDLKLRSCMTLFSLVDDLETGVFQKVLEKFFKGEPDEETIKLLKE